MPNGTSMWRAEAGCACTFSGTGFKMSALAGLAGSVATVALRLAGGFIGYDPGNPVVGFRLPGLGLGLLMGFRGCSPRGRFLQHTLVLGSLQGFALGAAGFSRGGNGLALGAPFLHGGVIRFRGGRELRQKLFLGSRRVFTAVGKAVVARVSQSIFLVRSGMLRLKTNIAQDGRSCKYSRQPIASTEKGQTSVWPSHIFYRHASTSVVMGG